MIFIQKKMTLKSITEEIVELRNQELDDLEIIDLVFSSALFGWANRLMHVLGDPVSPELEK